MSRDYSSNSKIRITEAYQRIYDLYTAREQLNAAVVYAAAMLRTPLLQVMSFATARSQFSFHRSEFTDPLLAGHKRFWLLALNLLVAGALAWLAMARLRRLCVGGGRRLLWGLAILVGGIPLFILYRCVETDRAWRLAPILKPEEIPSMWIQSA